MISDVSMDTTDLICCLQICLQYMGKQLHISNDLPMRVQTLPAHAVNAKPRTGVQNHREMHITCTAHLMYCAKCEALGNIKQSGSFCRCERQLGKNSQHTKEVQETICCEGILEKIITRMLKANIWTQVNNVTVLQ